MSASVIQKTLLGLKRRLDNNKEITVQDAGGDTYSFTFLFNEGASGNEILSFEKDNQIVLPPDYKEFLQLHNGATLFSSYGGGFLLLSLKESEDIMKRLGDTLPQGYYPVGYADGEMILINSSEVVKEDRQTNYLYFWSTGEKQQLNLNFEIWLIRFIQASGSYFWQWHYYTAKNFYRLCI